MAMRHGHIPGGGELATTCFSASSTYGVTRDGWKAIPHGTVNAITVHGPSLVGNLLGDTADPRVSVYLPPGYAVHPRQRYPVVYLLHGFDGSDGTWFKDPISDQDKRPMIPVLLDQAIASGTTRPFIVVAPDAFNTFHGSFYSTSVTTGDWEGYIARDLPQYIDAHYRTIAIPASRGIAGHSMGGYGALRIGFRHPEVFSNVYALSPFGVTWAADFLPVPEGAMPQLEAVTTRAQFGRLDFSQMGTFALAAAWSPDPAKPPFFVDLPNGTGEEHTTTIARWSANLILPQLDEDLPKIRQLHAIAFDAGNEDGFRSIPPGLVALDQALNERKVTHTYETFEGTHNSRLVERIATRVLPFFGKNLRFGDGVK
jgi:S-formylglutathione hydrolase FrmB